MLHQMLAHLKISARIDVMSSVVNEFSCELMDVFVGRHIFQYCLSVFCGIDLNFIEK